MPTLRHRHRWAAVCATLPLAACLACGRPAGDRGAAPVDLPAPITDAATLTIGDVDPDTPARRSERLQPLADYLANGLAGHGIRRGQVRIARDLEQMADFMRDGAVDLYLDSAYPTLVVREGAGSRVLLRRWVQDVGEYGSLIITAAGGGVRSLDDLRGRIVALQEEYSTSGYLLPAGLLLERGFRLRHVGGPREPVAPDEVGYLFTHDEENTLEMVVSATTAAGAIHDQEFSILPDDLRAKLRILDRSPTVPRQLLSARAGLEPAIVGRVTELLLALRDENGDPLKLEDAPNAWAWKFDALPPDTEADLERVAAMIARLRDSQSR